MNIDALLKFEGEALVRHNNGQLEFVGLPTDPRREAVLRLNSGQHRPDDIATLEGLPIFDKDALDPYGETVLFVVPKIGAVA